jgi:hypothetical protein
MIRRNAMIIDYWDFRTPRPFSGLFICDDKDGNELLRKMEPPRHDEFQAKRLEGGSAVLEKMRVWMRECIKSIMPKASGRQFELDDIARYLPDDYDQEDSDFPGAEENNEETFNTIPTETVSISVEPLPPVVIDEDGTENIGEEDATGSGEPDPKGGDDENTGGDVHQNGNGGVGPHYGRLRKDIICRAIHMGGGEYRLVIRSIGDESFNGKIDLFSVGDDGTDDSVKFSMVDISGCNQKSNVTLSLERGASTNMNIKLLDYDRISLKGVAREA